MTFDETLHDSFERLGDRLRAEPRTTAEPLIGNPRTDSSAYAQACVVESLPDIEPARTSMPHDDLAEAVRSIGAAQSLGAILDTLAARAAREAGRAIVLLVRGGRFRAWRLAGFGVGGATPDAIDIAEADGGLLAAALRTGAPVRGEASGSRIAPAFAALNPNRASVALPLAIGGSVIAMLYADQGGAGSPRRDDLDVGRLDVLANHAARCLEALTARKAARALLGQIRGATGHARPTAVEPPGADDLRDGDMAARRYARLLVSEIKLYHEPAVVAGRRSRDLAVRLGDEIARARALYEARVPSPVRQRTDYFHAELVRTLADGDASLMALEA